MAEFIEVTHDGRVALLRLRRPPVNAINDAWVAAFHGALDELDGRNDWSVLHIRSAIKVFCGGADLKQIRSNFDRPIDVQVEQGRRFQALFSRIELVSKVTLAEVGGMALGGGLELALACDIRVAGEDSQLGLTEVNLAIIPGGGGTQRLPRLVGKGRALQLILTGETISAQEAYRIGLVNEVVPAANLMERAEAILKQIAANAPIAVKFSLEAANKGLETSQAEGFALEASYFGICAATEDKKEGTSAFLEKRAPQFHGR